MPLRALRITAGLLLVFTFPAFAASSPSTADELNATVSSSEAEVAKEHVEAPAHLPASDASQESSTVEDSAAFQHLRSRVEELKAQLEEQRTASTPVRFNGSGLRIQSQEGRYWMQLNAYGQFAYKALPARNTHFANIYDAGDYFDADSDTYIDSDLRKYRSGLMLRRMRPSLRFGLGEDLVFRLEIDVGGSGLRLYTATVTGRLHERVSITAGLQKPLFNLEHNQSSRNTGYLERSYLSQFVPQRDLGVAVTVDPVDLLRIELGVFNGGGDNAVNSDIHFRSPEFQARVRVLDASATAADTAYSYQVGGALHYGNTYPSEGRTNIESGRGIYRPKSYGGRALPQVGDNLFHAGGPRLRATGFGYVSYGGFSLLSEYLYSSTALRDTTGAKADALQLHSGHVALSYTVGGNASFQGIKPTRTVHDGGLGALEIKARYSGVRFQNDALETPDIDNASLALAWWASPHVRLQSEYHLSFFRQGGLSDTWMDREHLLLVSLTLGF